MRVSGWKIDYFKPLLHMVITGTPVTTQSSLEVSQPTLPGMSKRNYMRLRTKAEGLMLSTIASLFLVSLSALLTPLTQAQTPSNSSTITLSPGFSPNPTELGGTVNGTTSLKEIVGQSDSPTGQCTGFADTRPDLTIVLTDFFNSLSLLVTSSDDTALAVKGPGGIWCNDDFQGKNPGISGQWLPGIYKIWVSSYSKDHHPAYTVQITENR